MKRSCLEQEWRGEMLLDVSTESCGDNLRYFVVNSNVASCTVVNMVDFHNETNLLHLQMKKEFASNFSL